MTLSPEERDRVLRMVAEHIVGEFRNHYPDFDELRVLPLAVAGSLLGITPRQVRASLPCVRISAGRYGVTMSAIRAHIKKNTSPPKKGPPANSPPAPAGLS